MATENQSKKSTVPLSAIVLAGGRSSRMGQDKALLPIQGVPLLQLVCAIASTLSDPVYVVTPWPERYQDLLPASCQFIREMPLPGESTGDVTSASSKVTLPLPHGPLVGFAQGLAQVKTDWVLLLACDLPRLRVEVLQEWAAGLDSMEEHGSHSAEFLCTVRRTGVVPSGDKEEGAIALLTHHAKGWDPLCGFYRRSCLSALTNYINQGGRSFQHWLAQHPVQLLPLPDAQMLFNCNTPADLAFLEKLR